MGMNRPETLAAADGSAELGEAEDVRVICRDANAIVTGRRAWMRYGVEG
jgi:hypothetical protein